jgi:hypothetical protein
MDGFLGDLGDLGDFGDFAFCLFMASLGDAVLEADLIGVVLACFICDVLR